MNQFNATDTYQWSLILQKVQLLHNCTNVYIIVPMLTYKKVPMSTKRSIILQKVQLLHNCTSVYIIVPMLTYKKIHFVYKKDTALVCHPVYERPIRRRHVRLLIDFFHVPNRKMVTLYEALTLPEHVTSFICKTCACSQWFN